MNLKALGMLLGARAEILLGVGEKVMRAGTAQVGAAYFRVGDGELR